jgi:hypothetical protein
MSLTAKLAQIAAIVAGASGCGGAVTALTNDDGGSNPPDGSNPTDEDNLGDTGSPGDGATPMDAAPEAIVACGPCGCPGAGTHTVTVTAAGACQILEKSSPFQIGMSTFGPACDSACSGGFASSSFTCELPSSYVSEVQSLNPDGGVSDGGAYSLDCPTSPATITITCTMNCFGRLTEGYRAPDGVQGEGERLAAMAYLEAVSVHAFERLARELDAHGAPPALLREARRARRDEVRHTAMTTRLARRYGASPRLPEAPAPVRARTLFEVALENAVEGCIRETYGAVHGLVEVHTSRDATMRRAMQSIAADECRHAELAWAVHAWAMPRLTEDERRAVEGAMKDAVAEIAAYDPRTASVLFNAERIAIA